MKRRDLLVVFRCFSPFLPYCNEGKLTLPLILIIKKYIKKWQYPFIQIRTTHSYQNRQTPTIAFCSKSHLDIPGHE